MIMTDDGRGDIFAAPRIFTISPSRPFLRAAAEVLAGSLSSQTLSDSLILTPNRRAARAFLHELMKASNRSFIAPAVRALGDLDNEDDDILSGLETPGLPPAISPSDRRAALIRLIRSWRTATGSAPFPPRSALAAADELATLIDQAEMSGQTDWEAIRSRGPQFDLPRHWDACIEFVDIVARAWPAHLAETGCLDAGARRRQAAAMLAAKWEVAPPDGPVIILGSTGAAEATRTLMKAVLTLNQGMVILPGLDQELTAAERGGIVASPGHPQFVLLNALATLNIRPEQVRRWPQPDGVGDGVARRRLISQSLAPAEATRGWNNRLRELAAPEDSAALVADGLNGLCLIEAEDEQEEAMVAALCMRETLETPGKTCALVTPDASLGRRVCSLLGRWGIRLSPSAGSTFDQTALGRLILLAGEWQFDPADPTTLLAILKHSLVRRRRPRQDLAALALAVELNCLRGARRHATLAQIRSELLDKSLPDAATLIDELMRIAPCPSAPAGGVATDELAGKAYQIACHLCEPQPEEDHAFDEAEQSAAMEYLARMTTLSSGFGDLSAGQWKDLSLAIAQEIRVPQPEDGHPRLAVWGPLEARLQHRDRFILASLNEGAWPQLAPADTFLNRSLRRAAGLPDPDERIGLAAHDFSQLACQKDVILLRARRVADKPSIASRWLWRLRTLAAGGLGDRALAEAALSSAPVNYLALAQNIRKGPAVAERISPPAPRPPVSLRRLDRFSPSRTAELIRDPYGDFARRILRLRPLKRVGQDLDASERGVAVHRAIERYERNTSLDLEKLLVEELIVAGATREILTLEQPLWRTMAEAYLAWSAGRSADIVRTLIEVDGRLEFESAVGSTVLTAKADRIDILSDGGVAIVDIKTGLPKTVAQVETGLEPQLMLEAQMAASGGYREIGPRIPVQAIYYQFSASRSADGARNGQPLALSAPVAEVAEAALDGLKRLISAYARPDQPYLSLARPTSVRTRSDFDRLARRAEWTVEDEDE